MSDEDKDSKTEDASDQKIQQTLDKGNVPFSKEITNVASLFAILIVSYFALPASAAKLSNLLNALFANINDWPLDSAEEAENLFTTIRQRLLWVLVPLVFPLMAIGLASALSQNQPRLILNRISPKFEKVSLMKGLKRLFGKQTVREFAKSLTKMGGAGFIAFSVLYFEKDYILSLIMVDQIQIPAVIHALFLKLVFGLAMTMITLGIADYVWVRKDWFDDQKMTKQEVKDEMKQSEGDPALKQKARSLGQSRSRRRMINEVDKSTLVIANPTHFAVAIRYRQGIDDVPVVLAKGQDLIALKIRGIAEENDIPVFEDKPLARALHKVAIVDKEIPAEFYIPVAALIRGLMKVDNKVAGKVAIQ